jgi:flagella basal body P-ring formation protein FlgA
MSYRTITTWVLVALAVLVASLDTHANDDVGVLQNALRENFPEVVRWDVQPVNAMHTKREMNLFARYVDDHTGSDITIYRDGALFAIKSDRLAHYLVRAQVQTITAKKYIHKGELLTDENMQTATRDMFALNCESAVSVTTGIMRSLRSFRAGDVVCTRDVEAAPLISKHDQLVLHCLKGAVLVSVSAEAMEEGDVGSQIKVRQDATHPVVLATVTGKGEVNACS